MPTSPSFFDPSSRRRNTGKAWLRRQWRNRLSEESAPHSRVTPISSRRPKSGGSSPDLPPLQTPRASRPPLTPPVRLAPPARRPIPSELRPPLQQSRSASSEPIPPLRPETFRSKRPRRSKRPEPSPVNLPKAAVRPPRHRERPRERLQRRSMPSALKPFLYVAQLSFVGVGLSAIAGTVLSMWTPSKGDLSASQADGSSPGLESQTVAARWSPELSLGQELTTLETSLQQLAAQYPGLTPGVSVVDVATGDYVAMSEMTAFPAASTIKIPILVAFFRAVDAGKVRLDEPLTMEAQHVAEGSGVMQYDEPGMQYPALEVALLMITQSDNTATNMLIDRLGGIDRLNAQFREWGLTETTLRERLPDLEGTNTTTPQELAKLLGQIERGELVSMRSRDRMFRIMERTVNDALLPQGLGEGASIAHKTGNLRSVLADAGSIDAPNGKRYIAVMLVRRPDEDERAADLIREMSAMVYDHFAKPTSSFPQTVLVAPTVTEMQQAQRMGR